MRLSLIRSDLAFTLLRAVPEGSWRWRGGVPVAEPWEVPLLVGEEDGQAFVPVDCFTMNTGSDGLILSEFARSVLDSTLSSIGEFWPVRVQDHSYWWFNCLACVDALDRAGTDADWGLVEGAWGSFRWITTTRRLAFEASAVQLAPAMFRVPEYPQGVLFCGDALSEVVTGHELTGFQFDVVWTSDGGGVANPPGVGLSDVFSAVDSAAIARARDRAVAILEGRTSRAARR